MKTLARRELARLVSQRGGPAQARIGVGCKSGRHRSGAVVETAASELREEGVAVEVWSTAKQGPGLVATGDSAVSASRPGGKFNASPLMRQGPHRPPERFFASVEPRS